MTAAAALVAACGALCSTAAAQPPSAPAFAHVLPGLTVAAPGAGSKTEAGIGALVPWADRLWAVGYVAHVDGDGLGLYEVDADLRMHRHPQSVTGTFANRLVHWESEQVFIGPHAIDAAGTVRTIAALQNQRLAATARHLRDPAGRVYFLTMEGALYDVDVRTLAAEQLFDLVDELRIDGGQPHFKAMHTAQGRVVVANNTYEEPEFLGRRRAGRLAEWDGEAWRILETEPFVEVSGKQNPRAGSRFGNTLFAVGWDRSSVILRVLHDETWTRYRLPKGSQCFDHTWNTEWMRIREAQTERYLMDAHGLLYELPALVYGGRTWGIKPICSHLRIITDFCHYRGLLVLAGDQTDNAVGQPQSGLWLGTIDDLHAMGKPSGWGGVWWRSRVQADAPSDPFLMTGFDRKTLHLTNDGETGVTVLIQIDFLGDGSFVDYQSASLPAGAYAHHVFPDGFGAHWVRLVPSADGTLTAHFHYH